MWGTLLGLVRDGQIIPWDNDVDVGMSRENFNKLLKLRKKYDNNLYSVCYFDDKTEIETTEIRIRLNGVYYKNRYENGNYDRRGVR